MNDFHFREGGRNGHVRVDPVATTLHPRTQAGRELLSLTLLCLLGELLILSGLRLHLTAITGM